MKIVKSYLLILISALLIIGLISCSSRFTPRKNDTDSFEKAELKELSSDNGNATTPPVVDVKVEEHSSSENNSTNNTISVSTTFFKKVEGKTYKGGGYSNTFSSDGKTITHVENGKTNTYIYSNESKGIAIYYNEDGDALRLDIQYGELYYFDKVSRHMRMDILY